LRSPSVNGEEPLVNLDWRRLRAVVLQSDDWGLCAWSPDEQAYRVLGDTPAFRGPAGRRYGASTLESAADVRALAQVLLEFHGADGSPPVWQANTIMATPDYARLRPPLFEMEELPLLDLPETPSRWQRPGLWEAVGRAREQGVWWPELHGLHHLPAHAWIRALRRGAADARRAHEHQSPICAAVEASGEYDPTEPRALRASNLERAVAKFTARFGRPPVSLCPPDYRWDERLEADAQRLGVAVLQGKGEQIGPRAPTLRRLLLRYRWRYQGGARFYMPPRIAFEPCGGGRRTPAESVEDAHRRVRGAWSRSQPAAVSSHRLNYAHLDPAWSAAGRAALRDLLQRLIADGAVFLVDDEVRQLHRQSWSARPVGPAALLLRYYGVPRQPLRFPAPAGATRIAPREGRDPEDIAIVEGELVARVNVGEYLVEWTSA
jgi:hypothetical protein